VNAGGDDRSPLAGLSGIKTVSGKVVEQSIAFRVVSTLAGGRPLLPEILAPSDLPPPEGSEF